MLNKIALRKDPLGLVLDDDRLLVQVPIMGAMEFLIHHQLRYGVSSSLKTGDT